MVLCVMNYSNLHGKKPQISLGFVWGFFACFSVCFLFGWFTVWFGFVSLVGCFL